MTVDIPILAVLAVSVEVSLLFTDLHTPVTSLSTPDSTLMEINCNFCTHLPFFFAKWKVARRDSTRDSSRLEKRREDISVSSLFRTEWLRRTRGALIFHRDPLSLWHRQEPHYPGRSSCWWLHYQNPPARKDYKKEKEAHRSGFSCNRKQTFPLVLFRIVLGPGFFFFFFTRIIT